MGQFTKQVGVPFRETHHIAGAAVALAESEGVGLLRPVAGRVARSAPCF